MIGLCRTRRLSSGTAAPAVSGCSGGASSKAGSSITGASADITRSGGKVTITSVPMRSLDFSVKVPPCMSTRLLAMGSPRPAPCSADLIELEPWPKEASTIGISSSGMPEPVSFAQILPARRGPADLEPDLAALRGELDRVRQQVQHDLADGALVAPDLGHALLEDFVDGDAAGGGAQLQEMMAVGHHIDQRDGFLVELVAAGLDAREVEDLVDQVQEMHAGIMDVAGVLLVHRHGVRAEDLALHHL